ncbi:MAG: pentapeptide repeat-containing protein [Nostoc sp. ChiSLP02]|nr:pentapeptide repeat-containing protein [Nostoc sp. DedSLP05]MDZ8099294.1 pentapeptide repeat-containing protein [Nostoc sp. DedSLP01]MDZ8187609.1 pentapeptide repeat-containing protein [Nostoc sp. ChiSLP02]
MHNLFFQRRRTQRLNAKLRREKTLRTSALSFAFLCVLSILLFLPSPTWAAQQPERTPLTLELLQERLRTPTLREGNLTVDLQKTVIDLRPENYIFRDAFYQLLRKELSTKPLGLDFSYALILGDFVGSDLGLRTPLYPQTIAAIFTPTEQEELQHLRFACLESLAISTTGYTYALPNSKDCRSLLVPESNQSTEIIVFRGALTLVQTRFNGEVKFANTFFLQSVNAQNATFVQAANWAESRFARPVSFSSASFRQTSNFYSSIFFDKANFKQSQFQEPIDFQGSIFEKAANFDGANFKQLARFNSVSWQDVADFSHVRFANQVQFTKGDFNQLLLFNETAFEQAVIFREVDFSKSVYLQGASILNQADFSDARFAKGAFLNVAGLTFNSNQAKILGNPGEIGQIFSVPRFQGNQNILRNLGQNFRQQQQVADANDLEYTKQRLRLIELSRKLTAININSATVPSLIHLGFSATESKAIIQRRSIKLFRNISELVTLADINLETYTKLSDRLTVGEPLSIGTWLLKAWSWLALSVLLLLSGYGTNFWLVFGVGGVAIAYFGLLFWLVDRYRRLRPLPIIPTYYETISILTSFSVLEFLSLLAIFRNAEQPLLTLGCLFIIIVPIPVALLIRLYQQGRYHDLMNISYFTEDGTFRQLRLLIGRLPVIPRNQTFRERYMPLLGDRHWNWLNYYDFSLNNLVRLGFNDIRLRDEHLPGIISALAWYQWSLGLIYITIVLWTLSRTIPGLNLLIYLK